jgi:peptide/nickel transport system permease protein
MRSSIPGSGYKLSVEPQPLRRRRSLLGPRGLRRHGGAVVGAALLLLFALVAATGPWLMPQDPFAQEIPQRLRAPSRAHLLGTDHLGRDVLSRIIYGSRISLLIGLGAVFLGGVFGCTSGLLGGYLGGWTDRAVVPLVDVFLCFPTFLLALALIAILGSGLTNVVLAIALAIWPTVARVARGEAIRLRERDFVEAARACGADSLHIVRRHIFPNAQGPLLVILTMGVGTAILSEASLGFLGLGVQPPVPTWGRIIGDGVGYMRTAPWVITFGGMAIFLAILSLNLLSDGLRDLFDPTMEATG